MLLTPPGEEHATNSVSQPPVTSELLPPTRSAIEHFAVRRSRLQFYRGVAIGIASLIAGMILLVILDYAWSLSTPLRTIGTLFVDVGAFTAAWLCGVRQSRLRDWTAIARSMEATTPPLRQRLLSAVELEDPRRANGSVELRSSLQSGVASQLSSIDIRRMLPWRLIRTTLLAAAGAVAIVALLSMIPSWQFPRRLARAFVPIAPIERASITQLKITAPQPPSRTVAQGDLIAVVATVKKRRGGDVRLLWESDDGRTGNLPMSPRAVIPGDNPSVDESGHPGSPSTDTAESYAVNLQIDHSVVHYRILAGDAETNWHTLSPVPRPRVVEFRKTYHFPAYAKLPDMESVDEHGDLEALVGSRVGVTVTFDQPVRAAQVWLGDYGSEIAVAMQGVGDDPTRFRFDVAIQTPENYRVDAVSLQSELDNPFLPRNTIDPVIDRVPTAAWSASLPTRQIVSSASILKFSGEVEDDLPMDRYVIESIVDEGPIREHVFPLTPASSLQEVQWDFDLMDLAGTGTHREALPAGTLLRTRFVALDRAGKRGESDWRYIYIAGEQFDPKRHASLLAWQALVADMNSWLMDLQYLIERINTAAQQAPSIADDRPVTIDVSLAVELNELEQRWQEIAGPMDSDELQSLAQERGVDGNAAEPRSLAEMMFHSTDSVSMDRASLMDRYATSTVAKLRSAIEVWQRATDLGESLGELDRKQTVDKVVAAARRAQSQAKQVSKMPSQTLATRLAEALVRDWNAIGSQTEMLADEDSPVPLERLPGQANLLVERLRQMDELIGTLQSDLPEETPRHLQNFRRFLEESIIRIDQAKKKLQLDRNPHVEKNFRDSIGQLLHDMEQHHAGSFIHGNAFNAIASAVRELGREDLQPFATIETLGRDERNWQASAERVAHAQERQGSAEIAPQVALEELNHRVVTTRRDELIEGYDRAADRERVRPDQLVATASDFSLQQRVIEHVTEPEFRSKNNETPEQLFDRIAKAARVLEAGGQLNRLTAQLHDIAERERFGEDEADRTIGQGMRLEHFQVLSESPLNQLRAAEIDNELIEKLQAIRSGSDFSQTRQWITNRRYQSQSAVSAAGPVQSMSMQYRAALPVIDAAMADARATLRAFLPTTSALAQAAAEEAKTQRAMIQAESPRIEPGEEATAAETSLDVLQDKVDRLASDLVDRANEADLNNRAQRELARDADAALQKIQQQMEAVATPQRQPEKSVSSDQADEHLEQLTQILENTAAHFAAAEAGEELSQTRQELRENLPSDPLESSLEDAATARDLTQTSPEELLRQLEQHLQRDPPMQVKLSDISQRTVTDMEHTLRSAAEREDRLQRELEKADPELYERKNRLRNQLHSLADQSRALGDQWLDAIENAAGRLENHEARDAVGQLRRDLRAASDEADQVQNDSALLQEIQAASQQLQKTLQRASAKTSELKEQAERLATEPIHPNEQDRSQRAEQLEAAQRRTQNEWIQSLSRQNSQWRQRRAEAGRRARQAEQRKREAEDQLRQAEKDLKERPDGEWLQNRVGELRQRVEQAERAAAAAKQTHQAADQAEEQAARFIGETKKQSVQGLDANNPSAEMMARASEISRGEMERLAAGLERLAEQSSLTDAPQLRHASAESLAKSQAEIRRTAQQAAEDLARAARHEERLGHADAAHQLEAAAKKLQQTAESPMQRAQESLRQAADAEPAPSEHEPASSARRNLAVAAQQLAEQADALSVMAEVVSNTGSPTGSSGAAPGSSDQRRTGTLAEADRPEKLARALDELDRALFRSAATSMQSESGQNSDGGGDSSSTAEAGKQDEPAPNAGEVSPTLAAAAQQAARQLAAERQQRLSQIASSGSPGSSDADRSQNQPGGPGSQSGDSFEMPSGGLLNIDDELRRDGQWGALRERTSEDVIQDRKARVPLPYRNAIEAYFQTIAGQAARAQSGAGESDNHAVEDAR